MTLKNDRYIYQVTWSEDDNEYVGLCVEFSSLSWLAETPELALKGIRKVVADVIVDMQENGEILPESITCNQYNDDFMVHILPEVHRDIAIYRKNRGQAMKAELTANNTLFREARRKEKRQQGKAIV